MAISKDYIPKTIDGFHTWQVNLVNKVVAGAAGWNIDPADVTTLQGQQTIYNGHYNKVTNPATKTKSAVFGLEENTKTYKSFIRTFVKVHLLYNPAITSEEKIDMGLNPGGNAPSPRPHILDAPNLSLKSKGNLTIVIECRVESDSSRPSVHPDADGVELRALIGATPPANFDQAEKMGVSSKAKINHILTNPTDAGKTIYMFARWINLSDPGKNGPWSNIAQVMIS